MDGFFEHVPSVWHKEILWAMSEGIHVFGAASMGALRAAELADFGMVGVGRIFELYRAGVLTADDEVALAHLPAEHGYRRVSEALVDMRVTLGAAVQAGVCELALAGRLIALAGARFYPERTWPAGAGRGARRVRRPARAGRARALAARRARGPEAPRRAGANRGDARGAGRAPRALRVDFTFQRTNHWDHALLHMRSDRTQGSASASAGAGAGAGAGADPDASALLDELRLTGDEQLYALAMQGALLRGLAQEAAERAGLEVTPESSFSARPWSSGGRAGALHRAPHERVARRAGPRSGRLLRPDDARVAAALDRGECPSPRSAATSRISSAP